MATIEELRAQLEERKLARASKEDAAFEVIERTRIENELKLDDLESELGLGTRRVDYSAAFSARTGAMVVLKAPKPIVWKRFRDRVSAEKEDLDVVALDFVRSCLAYPPWPEFNAILDTEPFLLDKCANECAALAGNREGVATGKS
jgi:hypothetical protein